MAETNIHQYTVQEKLNKMDVDTIQVSPTVATTSPQVDGNTLVDTTAIPNAVANASGTSILQSISLVCNDHDNKDSVRIVFTSDSTVVASIDHAKAKSILGFVEVNKGVEVNSVSVIGSVENIGMILRGDADKKVYFYCQARDVDAYAADDLTINFGIIKD